MTFNHSVASKYDILIKSKIPNEELDTYCFIPEIGFQFLK